MAALREFQRTIKLHRAQYDFRHSDSLYRGFVGGRGAGKSFVGAYDLLRRAKPGRIYGIGSPTGILLNDTTYPTFKAIAQDLGLWRSVKLTPYPNVTLAKDITVRFRTAEDPERMRGPNLSGYWLDEASLMKEEAFTVVIACLREAGEQGWLSATFTPQGFGHWTYDQFGKSKANTSIFHARTRDNPFLPRDFHDTLAAQYSGLRAEQELDGRFVNIAGAEWPGEYFPDSIWTDYWPKSFMAAAMALDPSKGKDARTGDYSAFVFAGVDTDWMIWIDANLAIRPTPQIVEDGFQLFSEWRPQAFVVEINAYQELLGSEFLRVAAQKRVELPVYGINNSVKKEVRIRSVGPYLAKSRFRFRNNAGTRLLVQQLRDFPEGEHDDGPDALEMSIRMLDHMLGHAPSNGAPMILRA